MTLLTRRFVLSGLIAAPAVVRASSLMPVKVPIIFRKTSGNLPSRFLGQLWWSPVSDTMRVWDGTTWAELPGYRVEEPRTHLPW